jgi:replication factor A1
VWNKGSICEYFAFLSAKYEVDVGKLFHALVSATENQTSKCGDLSFECRGIEKNKVILLITVGPKVIAQFPIPKEFFSQHDNPIKSIGRTSIFLKRLAKKSLRPYSFQIKDLRAGMKKISLKAKVVEIAKPTSVFTRFGNYATVSNVLLSDETGNIKLCLWNEQINAVSLGDLVQVENASISTFRGERQLRIGRRGAIHVLEASNVSIGFPSP